MVESLAHVRQLSVSQSDYANAKIPQNIFAWEQDWDEAKTCLLIWEFNKPEISLLSLLLDHQGDDGSHDKFVGYCGD